MHDRLLAFDVFPLTNRFNLEESIFPVRTEIEMQGEKNSTGIITYRFEGIEKEGSFDFGGLAFLIDRLDDQAQTELKEVIKQAVFRQIIEQTTARNFKERKLKEKTIPLRPLQEWICDTCGGKLTHREASVAWYKAKVQEDLTGASHYLYHGFRIVHDTPACSEPPDLLSQSAEAVFSLSNIQSPELIGHLMLFLEDKQCAYPQELLDIIKRIQLPYYEEGRFYLETAARAGSHPEETETKYHPRYLKAIITAFKMKNVLSEIR